MFSLRVQSKYLFCMVTSRSQFAWLLGVFSLHVQFPCSVYMVGLLDQLRHCTVSAFTLLVQVACSACMLTLRIMRSV